MFQLYVTNEDAMTILVVARSPHHADMQAKSLLLARGWNGSDGHKFTWRVYKCDNPGAYIVGGR